MFRFHRSVPAAAVSTPANPPRLLPRPGSSDPVRAFAYDALRSAGVACWIRSASAPDDAVFALTHHLPEIARSGARWSGAGVVRPWDAEWYAFSGRGSSTIVLVQPSVSPARDLARTVHAAARKLPASFTCEAAHAGTVPPELAAGLEDARALPIWELAGFAHLAPGALTHTGFATVAA
jgi:hypothetical protein